MTLKIRNLSHPRYQRRIPQANYVNSRFDEAKVHNRLWREIDFQGW